MDSYENLIIKTLKGETPKAKYEELLAISNRNQKLIGLLKEIQSGKEGQLIPYNVIKKALEPLTENLEPVIYLLENIDFVDDLN